MCVIYVAVIWKKWPRQPKFYLLLPHANDKAKPVRQYEYADHHDSSQANVILQALDLAHVSEHIFRG